MDKFNTTYQQIDQKIDRLITFCEALKKENSELKAKNTVLNTTIIEKEQIINELNNQNKVLSMAKSLSGDNSESGKEMKLKINELVREIDKCISLLND